MLKDFDIAGVYVTPLVAYYLAAFCIFLILRWIIVRAGLGRAFWRPELAETGLFLVILTVIARSF